MKVSGDGSEPSHECVRWRTISAYKPRGSGLGLAKATFGSPYRVVKFLRSGGEAPFKELCSSPLEMVKESPYAPLKVTLRRWSSFYGEDHLTDGEVHLTELKFTLRMVKFTLRSWSSPYGVMKVTLRSWSLLYGVMKFITERRKNIIYNSKSKMV